MADALQHLLDVLHESIVEDGLIELDVSEVALALAALPAGLALLVQGGNTEA